MKAQLTEQEKLFLDRMACYLVGDVNDETIEQAGKSVLADDLRLVGKLFRSDEFCSDAKKHLSPCVYKALRA